MKIMSENSVHKNMNNNFSYIFVEEIVTKTVLSPQIL